MDLMEKCKQSNQWYYSTFSIRTMLKLKEQMTGKYKSTTSHQEKYHYDENPIR